MAVAAVTEGGGLLDAVGKQILQFAEYRVVGVLIGLVLITFVFWRRYKSAAWPAVEDCIYVCTNALAVVGGFLVGVVFLLTRPPAIELLSQQAPIIIGPLCADCEFWICVPKTSCVVFATRTAAAGSWRTRKHRAEWFITAPARKVREPKFTLPADARRKSMARLYRTAFAAAIA